MNKIDLDGIGRYIVMEIEKGLPENWRERIEGKKVILYITSVGNMLNGGMKHIEKIEHVIETFRQQSEVVLWWRPHPLEVSTLESMRPELMEQYKAVRTQYENETWGILDTSADLHRAIAVSDAYYGDWSSVIHLYRVIGKPVLITYDNVKEIWPTIFYPIATLLKGDYFWFIQRNTNRLLKVHKDTLRIEKIIIIPYEPAYKLRDYNYHIIDCGNRLIILLGKSKKIYVYNIQTEEIESCEICKSGRRFRSEIVINKDNELLMFPYNDRELLTYSFEERKIQEKIKFTSKVKLAKNYEQVEDDIYTVDYDSNTIYKINLQSNKYSSIKVGSDRNKYWGIKRAGNVFVLPHTDRKAITLWNEEKEEVIELNDFPINYDCFEGYAYLSMYNKNESVYIIPFFANMILEVNTTEKTISQSFKEILLDTQYCNWGEYGEFFLDSLSAGTCVYVYAPYQKKWYIIDLDAMDVKKSSNMIIEAPEIREKIEQIIEYQDYNNEESFFAGECYSICTLDNYIQNVKKCSNEYKNKIKKGNAGILIHKYIIEN